MLIPANYSQTDENVLYQFIQAYPFATLVTATQDLLDADHLPFYLHQNKDKTHTLNSHIARGNPLMKQCQDGQSVLLIFHGPNAYVSPNFYPSKQIAGKAVPTWNYSVVHVRGKLHFKHDKNWLLALMENISRHHEAQQTTPWSISDAPANYIDKLLKAVVGIEITIDSVVGKFKLSQDKQHDDYNGVIKGLSNSESSAAKEVAQQMRRLKPF